MADSADDPAATPPEGFVRALERGAFSNHNGPYFHSAAGAQAFFAQKRHCNSIGLIHGGMLSAFLDGVLAGAAARGGGGTPITVHLSIDFLDMGRAGEWVIGEASLTRAASDLAFVEGRAHVGGRSLARATGVFKLMRRRPS
ncbi:MAG TPA: PaaI family thioesterase [Caulobacteraceae bacterium]|nr:PaaI family thioesterase [Caulobacteraceae bacterium]